MRIKKTFQGSLPENKILNTQSNSQTDTYSCDYINKLNVYSTEETKIGTWNGVPLYRKSIYIGNLPNNASKEIAHGISNIGMIHDFKATARNSTGTQLPLPIYGTNAVTFYANLTNLYVTTTSDRTDFICYVVLEYTKN